MILNTILLISQHVCSVLTCLLCLFYLCLHIYTSSEPSFYVVFIKWHMPPVRAHRLRDGSVKILFPNSKELNKEIYLRSHHPKRRLILSIFVSHGRSFTDLLDCSDKRPKIWVSRSTTKCLKLLSHIFCTVQVHLPTSVHTPHSLTRIHFTMDSERSKTATFYLIPVDAPADICWAWCDIETLVTSPSALVAAQRMLDNRMSPSSRCIEAIERTTAHWRWHIVAQKKGVWTFTILNDFEVSVLENPDHHLHDAFGKGLHRSWWLAIYTPKISAPDS